MAIRVVLATHNAGKTAEIAAILGGEATVTPLSACAGVTLPAEDGATYEDNAYLKASAAAAALALPALGDDSGLEVEALGGEPGVFSNRYAAAGGDAANNAKLLEALRDVEASRRGARFVCVAVLVTPHGESFTARGEVAGRILTERRGRGGFGYDPLFVPQGCEFTFAEMPPELKNSLSHRHQAFSRMAEIIRELSRSGRLNAAGG